MAEQYIYSRADRGFTNARNQTVSLGFGFVALSPGMDEALKRAVAVHCEDCPRLEERGGVRLPLLRKASLPKGRVLLQKSFWIEDSSRDFHVAHGYVFENEDADAGDPAGWFAAPFQLGNPNEVEGGILLDSVPGLTAGEPFEPGRLKDAIGPEGLGLDKGQFCRLLLACFDALASRRQVMVACDFENPKERELRASILYWIYICLPYDLRTGLGFDTVYTEKSTPGLVQFAFVDKAAVQTGEGLPGILVGNQTIPLGGNFLVLGGQLIHNDSKYGTAWYGKTGHYTRWLEQAVDTLWECSEEEQEPLIQALNGVYRDLQRQLHSAPEEKRLDPQLYDAACENSVSLAPQALAADSEQRAGELVPEEPLVEEPSVKEPSVEEPLVKEPPVEEPPVEEPPVEEPPVEEPPVEEPPVEEPPVEEPPIEEPPVEEPPVEEPPVEESPVEEPPVEESPVEESPVEEPPANVNQYEVFSEIFGRRMQPAGPRDVENLSGMLGSPLGAAAMGLLGAFMAREADAPEAKLTAVLCRYQEQLPAEIYSVLLRRLFFGGVGSLEETIWRYCSVQSSSGAARPRRQKWYEETWAACPTAESLPGHIRRELDALPGISEQERSSMENEAWCWLFLSILNKQHTVPASSEDLKTLNALLDSTMMPCAIGLLGVFMAREFDEPEASLGKVMLRYQKLLPSGVYNLLSRHVFYGKLSYIETVIWNCCNVESGDSASKRRLAKYHEQLGQSA